MLTPDNPRYCAFFYPLLAEQIASLKQVMDYSPSAMWKLTVFITVLSRLQEDPFSKSEECGLTLDGKRQYRHHHPDMTVIFFVDSSKIYLFSISFVTDGQDPNGGRRGGVAIPNTLRYLVTTAISDRFLSVDLSNKTDRLQEIYMTMRPVAIGYDGSLNSGFWTINVPWSTASCSSLYSAVATGFLEASFGVSGAIINETFVAARA